MGNDYCQIWEFWGFFSFKADGNSLQAICCVWVFVSQLLSKAAWCLCDTPTPTPNLETHLKVF